MEVSSNLKPVSLLIIAFTFPQSLVYCQYSLQRLLWGRSHGQSQVLHQSQAAGKYIFLAISLMINVLTHDFKGMEGKYKDCEGIDKEYFPCNVEPCDMQVSLSIIIKKISYQDYFSGPSGLHAMLTVAGE